MKQSLSAVAVVLLFALLTGACGGKGASGLRTAARDLSHSVKQHLSGGKTASSGPLFGRRAYSVPNSGTVHEPVVLVTLYDSEDAVNHRCLPKSNNVSVRGYYTSLFGTSGDDWKTAWQSWLGMGYFSMRDYYEHQSFNALHISGDIMTQGPQPDNPTPVTCHWYPLDQTAPDTYPGVLNPNPDISYGSLLPAISALMYEFEAGIQPPMNLTDPNVSRTRAFLNKIIDWLNNNSLANENTPPPTDQDHPFCNYRGRATQSLGWMRKFPDFSDTTAGQATFDRQDQYLGSMPGMNYTPGLGDRTPGNPNPPYFFSTTQDPWIDNFQWSNLYQNGATPIFDHLTIVIAGPKDTGPEVRECVMPILSDWGIHSLTYTDDDNNTVTKRLGSVTILFEREYNPYIICHEYGHALGLPDLYDQRNGVTSNGGDNAIGNKSLMGDMLYLNVPDSNTRYYSNNPDLLQTTVPGTSTTVSYANTSTANDLDCYSRYIEGWTNRVHILALQSGLNFQNLPEQNPSYNLVSGNALLQVPVPLINKTDTASAGNFYAIPMVPWWLVGTLITGATNSLPHGSGFNYYYDWSTRWPEWLLMENRGPDAGMIYDQFLDWNSLEAAPDTPYEDISGLLMWHLDSTAATWGTNEAAALGIQSPYNDGFVPTYNSSRPANCKFLRLLEADGAKQLNDSNPILTQYVLADPYANPTADAKFGDKRDVWAWKTDGTQDFTSWSDWRQLPYLTPWHRGMPWWSDSNPTEFQTTHFKYVNTECNRVYPGSSTDDTLTTGLFVRNFRKGGSHPWGDLPVYEDGYYPVYCNQNNQGNPFVQPSESDSSMVYADIFKLPRMPGNGDGSYLAEMNAVKLLSVSMRSSGQTATVHVRAYAANSSDFYDSNNPGYVTLSVRKNGGIAQIVDPGEYLSGGHGVVDLTWDFQGADTGTYDFIVTFFDNYAISSPTPPGTDHLENYWQGGVVLSYQVY